MSRIEEIEEKVSELNSLFNKVKILDTTNLFKYRLKLISEQVTNVVFSMKGLLPPNGTFESFSIEYLDKLSVDELAE